MVEILTPVQHLGVENRPAEDLVFKEQVAKQLHMVWLASPRIRSMRFRGESADPGAAGRSLMPSESEAIIAGTEFLHPQALPNCRHLIEGSREQRCKH